jgi:hypothetical protein
MLKIKFDRSYKEEQKTTVMNGSEMCTSKRVSSATFVEDDTSGRQRRLVHDVILSNYVLPLVYT